MMFTSPSYIEYSEQTRIAINIDESKSLRIFYIIIDTLI